MRKSILLLILFCVCLIGCHADSTEDNPSVTTPSPAPDIEQEAQDYISLEPQPYDLSKMRLAWCTEIDLKENGSTQLVSVYVRASRNADESFVFDDGQDWALLVETEEGVYPLFPRSYVQFGTITCTIFRSMEDERALHIVVKRAQGAGLELYDCVYSPAQDAFIRTPVYYAGNISWLGNSEGLNDWFWNPKLESYKSFLVSLPKKDRNEAVQAFEALQPMMSMGEILPNEAVDAFINFQQDLVSKLEYPDYDPYSSSAMPELLAEYAPYYIQFYESEGFLCAQTDMAAIATALAGRVDWDYSEYFDFIQWQNERGLEQHQIVSDACLMVSWNQFADLLVEYDRFIRSHEEFAKQRGLDEVFKQYLLWYLSDSNGLDNSRIADKSSLIQEVKESYEYLIETYPDSRLHDAVLSIYDVWKEHDWKNTQAVRSKTEEILAFY